MYNENIFINSTDTELIIETQESGVLLDNYQIKPDTTKTLLFNPSIEKNNVKIVNNNSTLEFIPHLKSNAENPITYEKKLYKNIEFVKTYDKFTYSFTHTLTIDMVGYDFDDVIAVFVNNQQTASADYMKLPIGKLSIRKNVSDLLDYNTIVVLYNTHTPTTPTCMTYDTDTLTHSQILALNRIDVNNFTVKKTSEQRKDFTILSNTGKKQQLNTQYQISFDEQYSDNNLYDKIIQLQNLKFKIIRIIYDSALPVYIEYFRDCVLTDEPSYSEDSTVNKYSYTFNCNEYIKEAIEE